VIRSPADSWWFKGEKHGPGGAGEQMQACLMLQEFVSSIDFDDGSFEKGCKTGSNQQRH
jgi:hypothetical protein